MTLVQRFIAWWLDYAYAGYWTVRHLLGGNDATRFLGGDRSPVLVLPGVYETWQFMRPVAERLHAAGHPVYVVPGFGHNSGTIPEMAARAQKYLETVDLRGVIIVAHSKGGIIGKHMMIVDDVDRRVTCVIAVNSPFGGSRYARFARSSPLREFLPTAETLQLLAKNAVVNTRITSIYSQYDPVLPDGSFLDGATNVELPVGGHFRLLATPLLLDAVQAALPHG